MLTALAITGCTGAAREAADPASGASPSAARPPGFDLAPSTFDRVTLCGPDVTAPNGSDGRHPCRAVREQVQVQQLQEELLAANAAEPDGPCLAASRRLVLTFADTSGTGLRVPSVEAFVDCRLARRPFAQQYFSVSAEAQRLMLAMGTVPP